MMYITEPTLKKAHVRRSHSKVKSGCLTCKIRRVKCDEAKPSCLRCIRFGIKCDGYPQKSANLSQRSKALLLPKSHYTQNPPLPKAIAASRFENEEGCRYFEVFSTSTAYEIFPNVEMGKLRLMFLQACEAKESIRHAVIALGALDMTSQSSHIQGRGNTLGHYEHAIKEYALAIKCAQMDDEKDLRIALITSLIILSFEGWVGNHELAVQQIRIGMGLLKAWRENSMATAVPQLAAPVLSDEENTLSHVFTRLSIQLRSAPTERPPQPVDTPLPPLRIDPPESFGRMPMSFETLNEAGKYYSDIVRFAVTFVAKGLPRIARASSLTETYPAGVTGDLVPSEIIPPEIIKAQGILAESLHRWMEAFRPLKMSRQFKTLDERKALITLELQMKATYIGTVKSLAQNELVFDAYYEVFRDIIDLSEALLKSSNSSKVPKFRVDSAVIIPLWFTGHKCRDPFLRRRVISLLIKYPGREGVWDSVFAGLVIECLRSFEEEHLENGRVPGWARIRNTSYDIDLEKRTVEVKCQQRTSATSGRFITRRKTVDCYVHTGVALDHLGSIIAR